MNWNNNDTKYILKRFIIYVLIAIAMFIIGIWKTKAVVFDVSVTPLKTQKVYSSNISASIGIQSNGYVNQNHWFSSTQNITCNTDKCGVEFYYTATMYQVSNFSSSLNNYSGSISSQVVANSAQLFENNFPSCTVSNNTISCIVDNNTNWGGLKLQFSGNHLSQDTNEYTSRGSIQYSINDIVNIYDISGSIASAIEDNTQAINDVNNSINSDNVTSSDADDFSNNQAFTDSTGLESVIQLPLNMVNSLTSTCQPINITIPFIDYTGQIPCMSTIYRSKFNTLYTIVKLVINGFFVYRLLLKVYELVHNAKQPDEDKLEVIDL